MVLDVWYLGFDIGYAVFDIQYSIFGIWCLMFDIWKKLRKILNTYLTLFLHICIILCIPNYFTYRYNIAILASIVVYLYLISNILVYMYSICSIKQYFSIYSIIKHLVKQIQNSVFLANILSYRYSISVFKTLVHRGIVFHTSLLFHID